MTSPGLAVLAGVSMTLASLSFAVWVAHRLEGVGAGPTGLVTASPGRMAAADLTADTGASQSCSPVRLASVPGLGKLHWALIAAQLLLAPLLIRSRSARRRRRPR